MKEEFLRTELLLGEQAMKNLKGARVSVFGVGGVGGYAIEGLARAGVGSFILVDNDEVCKTNINRQIIATQKTIGQAKVQVMKERILEINPEAEVIIYKEFYLPESEQDKFFDNVDYIVDAIDTVTAKIELVLQAERRNIPLISSMGTGNKLDPTKLEVADIYKTSVCPLAKVMRKELKNRSIKKLKVVFSKEIPIKHMQKKSDISAADNMEYSKPIPGSVSFVPSVAGLIICSEVIRFLANKNQPKQSKEGS